MSEAAKTELAKIVSRADRVHQVLTWIVAGTSQYDIEQTIAQAWPDAKTQPLIIAAMKQIAAAADDEPEVLRGWAIEATREIYRRALEVGDLQTALRALKQTVELSKQ